MNSKQKSIVEALFKKINKELEKANKELEELNEDASNIVDI
jgi:hypothetical protein